MKSSRAYNLESCVVSLEEARRAQKRGADRVEVCASLEVDGLTPSFHLVSTICDHLKIPVRVMIRLTPEGFAADSDTLDDMIRTINEFKHLAIDGYVIGVMKDNRIDRYVMEELMKHTAPFPITFHKAIDLSDDIESDIEWLNQHHIIDSLLTSGGASKAMEGIGRILLIKNHFNGDVMAAGKITPEVLPVLAKQLQLKWYHGSAIV